MGEEPKPEPKKKLSRSDLKPAVQIKVAAAPEPAIGRRKKKPVDDEPVDDLFAGVPEVKPKVKDEFAEKDKKPKEEEKIIIEPAVLQKEPAEKAKVKDEFAEKEKKPKEETKIIITPAVLPTKKEEESSSEEEEEVKPEPKKKLSRSDLKPTAKIKVEAAPQPTIPRRKKKKEEDEPVDDLFAGVPEVKPKVKDEFKEKDKKPKEEEKIVIKPAVLKPEESSSEEEEEVKPEPKKKLSRSDLKPAVQIKVAAAPQPAIPRRKKREEDEPKESLFDDLPEVKPKVRDEFAE